MRRERGGAYEERDTLSSNYRSLGIHNNGPRSGWEYTTMARAVAARSQRPMHVNDTNACVTGRDIYRAVVRRSRGGRERAQLLMCLPPLLMGY